MKVTVKRVPALLLNLLLLCLSLAAGFSLAPESTPVYRQLPMPELADWMAGHHDYVLVDVRTPGEFADGHIPGAINLPMELIVEGYTYDLPDKGQSTLVYCRSGVRSKQAADSLLAQGYRNVIDCGGILDWPGEVDVGSQ